MEKYQDLKREIGKIWNCKRVTVIPVIIGALGTISSIQGIGEANWVG